MRPVFDYERHEEKDRDGEEIVVVHGVPVFETSELNSFSHDEDLR